MESTIADWVIYKNPKSRKDFIEELCSKGFPSLLKYIDMYEDMRRSGFVLQPSLYAEFILPKRIVMDMVKNDLLRKGIDFINNENGVEVFSSHGMRKILLPETKKQMMDLDYLEFEYKMYMRDILDLRVDV